MDATIDYVMDAVLDSGYLPVCAIKLVTRHLTRSRIATMASRPPAQIEADRLQWVAKSLKMPMAIETAATKTQQYEVGTGVFACFLGPRMKYSCSLWDGNSTDLAEAEEKMLELYIPRGSFADGMHILDLGCGWGSAVLFFAERFPRATVTGFSNSTTQKEYIDQEAKKRGLANVKIITGDVVDYEFEPEAYDRILSVELFEHMKNYELLMAKLARALKPCGKLLVHHFCHRDTIFDFDSGWMSRYFYTGGTMPCADLLAHYQRDLALEESWWVDGMNYSKTLQAWLENWQANKEEAWPHLVKTYGAENAQVWYNRWIAYHASLTEFFAVGEGRVYGVTHMLFQKKSVAVPAGEGAALRMKDIQ